jgi:prepilin-type N-terminal cleavage/methylation domain-containing protein
MDMITLRHRLRPSSFTLIEMLAVITIIAILASLILWAGSAVMTLASRNRARSEIQAFSTALENYKVDNGAYPADNNLDGPPNGSYSLDPSVAGGSYQFSSETLYQALSGQTNFSTSPTGVKAYYTFKGSQVGNTGLGLNTYVQDPFGFSYGYSPGDGTPNHVPYSGSGFFDLWSTGGTTETTRTDPTPINSWISNWKN